MIHIFWRIILFPIRWFLPNCKEETRLLSQRLDQPLNFRQRMRVRLHLLTCGFCSRYGRQIELIHKALHRLSGDNTRPVHHHLPQEAKTRIKETLSRS